MANMETKLNEIEFGLVFVKLCSLLGHSLLAQVFLSSSSKSVNGREVGKEVD